MNRQGTYVDTSNRYKLKIGDTIHNGLTKCGTKCSELFDSFYKGIAIYIICED
jgi:hypothetical protein